MSIPVEPESDEIIEDTSTLEHCVFCDKPTRFWYVALNRPVCKLCSKVNEIIDIQTAPYNY